VYLLIFHAYIKEMHGSRNKIPRKNLANQRCGEEFKSGVKGSSHVLSEVIQTVPPYHTFMSEMNKLQE
jgi:hypothetical protein